MGLAAAEGDIFSTEGFVIVSGHAFAQFEFQLATIHAGPVFTQPRQAFV
jgi:hypothetical protein